MGNQNSYHYPQTVRIGDDPAVWLGMAEDLDGWIGAVLDKLTELGIADNTSVVLVSDNGYRHEQLQLNPSLTQPLHGGKWWLWQGGIRVPMIVRGPGIKPGAEFEGDVVNYDFLPTFVEWAGGDPTKLKDIDGVSLAPYMAGKQPDDAFLNRPPYFTTRITAARCRTPRFSNPPTIRSRAPVCRL